MHWRATLGRVTLFSLAVLLPAAAAMAKPKPPAHAEPKSTEPAPLYSELEMNDSPESEQEALLAPELLSRGEMLNLARQKDKEMALALVEGERAKADAIRTRDALKLSCVQDRLARMKLTRRMAIDRLTALARQDIQSDDLRMRHEFRAVEMATERINGLRQEMSQCVGESLDVAYGAEMDKVPTAPATDPAVANGMPTDRPPPASLFQ